MAFFHQPSFFAASPFAAARRSSYHLAPESFHYPTNYGYAYDDYDYDYDDDDYYYYYQQQRPFQRFVRPQLQSKPAAVRRQSAIHQPAEWCDPWAEQKPSFARQQQQQQRQRQQQQQQQEERLRRQQLQEQRILEQRKIQQEKLRKQQQQQKQQLYRRYNQAALVIQKVFRKHLTNRRHSAASTIQRSYRRHVDRQLAKQNILEPLRQLQSLIDQLSVHRQQLQCQAFSKRLEFDSAGRVRFSNETKDYLAYEDGLLKLMLRVDGIVSGGEPVVRQRRKELVLAIQRLLDQADDYRRQQLDEAYQSQSEESSVGSAAEEMDTDEDDDDNDEYDMISIDGLWR